MPPDIDKLEKLSKMPSAQLVRVMLMIALSVVCSIVAFFYFKESRDNKRSLFENKSKIESLENRLAICEETKLKFYQDLVKEAKEKEIRRDREQEVKDSTANIRLIQQENELKSLVQQANRVLKKQKQ